MNERVWSRTAYGYAMLFACGFAYFLVRMPYQVSDDLEHLLIFQFQSLPTVLAERVTGPGSMRPVMWLQQKLLFDMAPGGHYFATYKAFHVAQLLVLAALFVNVLRVRDRAGVVVLPLALAALLGMHTFNVVMREGYPVNHFMSILLCCLGAVALASSSGRWWKDVAAVLLFVYAVLTIETGVLVWVCLVAGYVGGWRGISLKGIAAASLVLAGYLVVRFVVLDVGSRTLTSMSSGYGFSVRDTGALADMFGDAPWKFYLYNIVSSALTVLFSEPRAGVFQFTRHLVSGSVPAWSVVNVAVSTLGTVLIGVYAVRRTREWWRSRILDQDDRLLLVCAAVLGANAIVSYPYTKDVIVSPAGMFYALALFLAMRDTVRGLSAVPSNRLAPLLLVLFFVLSAGWTLRAAMLVNSMRATAFVNRNDWTLAEEHMDKNRPRWRTRHPDAEKLLMQLREEVVRTPVPQPFQVPRWTRTWFDPY